MIDEWKLAYSPQNAVLDKLMERVCDDLSLKDCFGVEKNSILEKTVTSRRLVAGIHFHNAKVLFDIESVV